PASGLEPVHGGHADVHQDHVRVVTKSKVDRLDAVGCLSDHAKLRIGLNQDPESGADQGLIVGQQDPDHAGRLPAPPGAPATAAGARASGSGRTARTCQPRPGRGPASSVPPKAAARSRMPAMPAPAPVPSWNSVRADTPRPSSSIRTVTASRPTTT